MDLIEEFAYPLPVIVICEMLGVPVADHERFKGWGLDIARGLDTILLPPDSEVGKRSMTARRALADYFRGLIAERRAAPRSDLLSALIAAEEAGDKLNEEELLATCILLLVAGHETTVNLIGNGTLALLRHPGELRRLRENPTLIVSAVEELLRYDGPVQRTARIPSEDVTIGGRTIGKGEMVMPFIGAADRDPAQFPEPDRLDIAPHRQPPHRLRLGHPLLPRRPAGAGRGPDRHQHAGAATAQARAGHRPAGAPREPHAARVEGAAGELLSR